MKTRILTLTAALLLLGGFVACNDSEESEYIGTPPVTASADVSAFFKTYLPSSSSSHPEPEFNFSEIDDRDIECFVINSMEEFEAVAPPSVELPVIDFDKYTLLFYRAEQIRHMLGNTVVTMRLYATIYPKPCHVRKTGYEDMLTSYALMLRKLELEKEKSGELDAYCVHEQKLLLMAVTYRLCSIFSASFKAAGKEMERKIAIFESLVLLIEKNYMRERSVAFYADELCLTPKYLSVLVKSVCGQTVQQLLFKAMIRRSIYLMKNTTKTIQQIANELSFPNASAFGTFFKKHTGLSPKHYRNWEEGNEPPSFK